MLGSRLKELRGKLTQQEIADKLDISRARYSHYENEHVQPDNDLLQKIADLHRVTIDYLLGRTNEKNFKNVDTEQKREVATKLLQYLEQGLSNDEIKKRMDFMVDVLKLNDAQVDEFMSFVRWQLSTKKEQPAASKGEEQ